MAPPSLLVLGSGGAGLTLALRAIAAGGSAAVFEPDPHAAERARSFAMQDDPDAVAKLDFVSSPWIGADIVFDAVPVGERGEFVAQLKNGLAKSAIAASPWPDPGWTGADPERCVRFVPFQPMDLRTLVELTPLTETAPDSTALTERFARAIGRRPIVLPPGSRSVGLRLLDRLYAAADALLLRGAVLWELDEAMQRFGFDLGPFEAEDLMGLDTGYARRRTSDTPALRRLIADRAVSEGRIGKKIGWGWYRYPGGGGAVIDPLIEDLVREEARFAGIAQQDFPSEEIADRLVLALADEAAVILEEGDGMSARGLDEISVHGLGFPPAKGGIISHARTLNANAALERIALWADEDPGPWHPDAVRRALLGA